ncbi:MAG: P-II family nitrogen regulator [Candidatus Nitrosopolaris sp.]
MKQIDIIIPNERFATVNKLLYKHKIIALLVSQLSTRGGEKLDEVHERVYVYNTGKRYVPEFVPRYKLELLVSDSMVKPVVDDLLNTLNIEHDVRGKILVKDVAETYDIGLKPEVRSNP